MDAPIEVVCCYAHEDEADLKNLFKHLNGLEVAHLINVWRYRQILAGEDFAQEIKQHLDQAQIILLIISINFITSDYCREEMQHALDRQESGVHVLPVILHPCNWKSIVPKTLRALPTDGKPISNRERWPDEHDALLNVTEGVQMLVDKLQEQEAGKEAKLPQLTRPYTKPVDVPRTGLFLHDEQKDLPTSPLSLALVYQRKGDALFKRNFYVDALEAYQQALHYDTTLLHSCEQQGCILVQLARYDEALPLLDEAIQRASVNPYVYLARYNALVALNRVEEAVTFYEQALAKFPKDTSVHQEAALLFEDFGRYEQALTAWERVIRSHPDEVVALLGKARALTSLDRYEQALVTYERATPRANDAHIYLQKGLLLEILGRYPKAVMAYDTAIQRQPDLQQAHFGNQRIHERLAEKARKQALGYVGSYQLIYTLRGSDNSIACVSLSPDGSALVSGGSGDWYFALKLWDAFSGTARSTFLGHDNSIACVAFSPDGRSFVSGSLDDTLRLWDAFLGKELRTFRGHRNTVTCVAFNPDGQSFISGSQDSTLKRWDLKVSKEQYTYNIGPTTGAVTCVAFSPDGQSFISGSQDSILRRWDLKSGKELRTYSGHTGAVTCVAFSPDGQSFVSGSQDGTLKRWDLKVSKEQHTYREHAGAVTCVAFGSDRRSLVSGSQDTTLKVWNFASGKELQTLQGHRGTVNSLTLSQDGYTLASGSQDGAIKIWSYQ